jgi:predicted HAD superfamily Cof-like phosphohydrolase
MSVPSTNPTPESAGPFASSAATPSSSRGTNGSTTPSRLLREFHAAFDLPVASVPTLDVPPELAKCRADLLLEEMAELDTALGARDLVGVADALGDLVYVLYGTALTFGINLDAVMAEVHRSNMTKLDEHGRPVVGPDGKVLKGPDYRAPEIAQALGLRVEQSQPRGTRGD